MVKAELVKNLISKIYQNDEEGLNQIIFDIIDSEEKSKHYKFAKDLSLIIEGYKRNQKDEIFLSDQFSSIPLDRDRNLKLFDVIWSKKTLSNIVLETKLEFQIKKILREWAQRSRLAAFQMKPMKNLLFYGPPGCGKTLCAHVISGELKLPLIIIKTESIISSLLGETAANLKKIFDNIGNKRSAIVFFDEFDSLAKSRTDVNEHGEIRRTVSLLLQIIENANSNILIITATNHPQILDKATWRRFDSILQFPFPEEKQYIRLIELKLINYPHKSLILKDLHFIKNLSHADIERACFEAIKEAILKNNEILQKEDIIKAIYQEIRRKEQIEKIT